jgi:hypothetical protein
MVFLASYTAFGGGSIGNVLAQWESAGIFTYVLPFLLIFAIIYSVLSFTKVFRGNNAVNAVISLAVALLALQFQIVPIFFAEIFPRVGIALSVLLAVVIIGGFFVDPSEDKKWIRYVLMGITAIILIFVIGGSLGGLGLGWNIGGGWFYGVNWAQFLIIALVIGLIIWIVVSGNKGNKGQEK